MLRLLTSFWNGCHYMVCCTRASFFNFLQHDALCCVKGTLAMNNTQQLIKTVKPNGQVMALFDE